MTTTETVERRQSQSTVTPARTRVATVAVRVLERVRVVDARLQEQVENAKDLEVLKEAEERYAGLTWRTSFKPLK